MSDRPAQDASGPGDASAADAPVRVARDGGVVRVTLDRPAVRNAIDAPTMIAVSDAFAALDDNVRAVVLTGAGDVFSAGADLSWMAAAADASYDENVADSRTFDRMLRAVHDAPVPVIARVNGHAIAGASGLIACADIAIAVRGARFGFTEVRLGLVPSMISSYVIPRIGLAHAHRYLLTGEVFDADRAHAIGLVHEVCEPDDLDAAVDAILEHLLAAGPRAVREAKRLLPQIAAATSPAETEELRIDTIARARASDEAQERISAFLERRQR